jgi:Cd2+/Zn2+-exporting ATPase
MSHCCGEHHHPNPQPVPAPGPQAAHLRRTRLRIEQMDCPTEERLIRDRLANHPGIEQLSFNLLQRQLIIDHQSDALPAVLAALKELGMAGVPVEDRATASAAPGTAAPLLPLLLAGAAALAAELLHFFNDGPGWLIAALAIAAILGCGLGTYRKGWIALKNRDLNINALMSIAVTGALLIGQWPEAAMVMVLFTLAERIEAGSLERARRSVQTLMQLAPERVLAQQADGSWVETETHAVALGTRLRARPGERIAMDGTVLAGRSAVDQAPITGESLPVEKQPGDAVFAGSINQSASLEYQAGALADDSTLARIIRAIEQAQGSRAPTQRFVDRFARIYTPLVVLVALAVAVLPPLLLSGAWLDWIYRALVLLVVACPCALVISTPVSIVSGLTAATRKGILIKGGSFLEQGQRLSYIALDKTGTLTEGRPRQTDFVSLLDDIEQRYPRIAASLAAQSDHPVSRAIAEQAASEQRKLITVSEFTALPGSGVRGRIADTLYQLGNQRLVSELGLMNDEVQARIDRLERQGKTVVALCDAQRVLALYAVADTLKPSSREAIAELHRLGIKTVMFSGDNIHSVQAIAEQAGIDQAHAELLPDDKLQRLRSLQQQGLSIGMAGDGINDAPALAAADIGFAMGAAGTDIAIETADVALMDDDLRKLPAFIRLSRQTSAILRQNIAFALLTKAMFLGFAVTGQASMWMAVFADMGVSLLVVLNGLRLLRK